MLDTITTWLTGKKTYLVALAAMTSAVAQYASGTIDLTHALDNIFLAVLAATLRHGISTSNL